MCWYKGAQLSKFITVIDRIFDNDDSNKFKTSVAETLPGSYRWIEFNEGNNRSILSWCFNNDCAKIKELKKSIPIDDIFRNKWESTKLEIDFYGLGTRVRSSRTIRKMFTPLDSFLLWYFESLDKVKKYKLEKVFGYDDGGDWMFSKYGNSIDEKFTRVGLPWFFDGDEEQIRKFKNKYKDGVISRLIDVE
ncbi:hypothetical protein U1Q18_044672 [Sarracenia purpurea var. burkii]